MKIGIGPQSPSSGSFSHDRWLASVLATRGLVRIIFALWLLTRQPAWAEIFRAGSFFGFVDGSLGLVSVAVLLPRTPGGSPPLLRVTMLIDAIARLSLSLVIRAFPGIPDTPITVVMFFAVLDAYAVGLGMVSVTIWLVAHARWRKNSPSWRPGTGELFDPFAVAGVVTIAAIGYSLRFGPPVSAVVLRANAATVCAVFSVTLLVAAAGALRRARISVDRLRPIVR